MMSSLAPSDDRKHISDKIKVLTLLFPADHQVQISKEGVTRAVLSNRFGANGEDSYFTELFLNAIRDGHRFDPVALAICNHAILELTYQTRFLTRQPTPETVIFFGRTSDFTIAMAHHNDVFGILMSGKGARPFAPDGIRDAYLSTTLSLRHLAEGDIGSQAAILAVNSRDLVGCVVFDLDLFEDDVFDTTYLLDQAKSHTHAFTTYIAFGRADAVCRLASAVEGAHPEATSTIKGYTEKVAKAVLVIQNMTQCIAVRCELN